MKNKTKKTKIENVKPYCELTSFIRRFFFVFSRGGVGGRIADSGSGPSRCFIYIVRILVFWGFFGEKSCNERKTFHVRILSNFMMEVYT